MEPVFDQDRALASTAPSTNDFLEKSLGLATKCHMPNLNSILWDLDDTVLKTERIALRVCHRVLNAAIGQWTQGKEGLEGSVDDFIRDHSGGAFRDMLTRELASKQQKSNISITILDQFVNQWSEIEQSEILRTFNEEGLTATEGTLEFLNMHEKLGLTPSIVSSSSDERINVSLKAAKLLGFFPKERIFSAQNSDFMRNGGKRKPSPDIYLSALETLNLRQDNAISIEDSKSGVISALKAGLNVVVCLAAYNEPEKRNIGNRLLAQVDYERQISLEEGTCPLGRIVAVVGSNNSLIGLIGDLKEGREYSPIII